MSSAMIRLLLPKLPLIFKQTILHALSLSPTSSKWNLKTELIVCLVRSLIEGGSGDKTVEKIQRPLTRDLPVKGKMWISRVTIPPPPDDNIRQAVFQAIDDLKEDAGDIYAKPEFAPVEAEWTGYRASSEKKTPEPSGMSDKAKYDRLMAETTSNVTILYFHGGAHYLCDPATHRLSTSKLAQLTGGRVFSVRYRLAPQNPFPSGLLDALTAYFALLYPPPGSLHKPVSPADIIIAGDSAGGNLSLSLILLLLHLNQSDPTATPLKFHTNTLPHPLPLPAGIATNSPWTDLTHSCPSARDAKALQYDYLRQPPANHNTRFARGPSWPAQPRPRVDLYAEGSMLCHPLVSPLAAPGSAWRGCPPMFACVGEELLGDEGRVVLRRVARANGGRVRFEGFEAMPHCFAMVLQGIGLPGGVRCFEGWARFCMEAVGVANGAAGSVEAGAGAGASGGSEKGGLTTGGVWVEAKTLKETPIEIEKLTDLADEQVLEGMRAARDARVRVFEAWLSTSWKGEARSGVAKL